MSDSDDGDGGWDLDAPEGFDWEGAAQGADDGWDLKVGDDPESFDWGETDEGGDTGPDVIRCSVGSQLFAVEAEFVDEIISPLPWTDIPRLPPHVLGVAMRRRRVLSVVDASKLLTIDSSRPTDQGRLLVTTVGELTAALLVDDVSGLELWPEGSESEKLLKEMAPNLRPYAMGARWAPGGVVILLDAERILDAASVR